MQQAVKTRLATAFVLLVVFVSGVVLGLAADSSLSAASPPPTAEVPVDDGSDTPEEARDESDTPRRYIYHQVEPNEEQLRRIEEIVTEWRARREAFDEESRTRWEEGRREFVLETRNAIKGVLTADQAAEYQRLLDEWEARRADDDNEDDRK